VLIGDAGDDVIIGGPGIDIIDGGDGDDIEIQLVATDPERGLAADSVTSATAADRDWLATHVRIVDGTTVLDIDGKQRALPNADLSVLVQDAASA
jgi:hypothetical protein